MRCLTMGAGHTRKTNRVIEGLKLWAMWYYPEPQGGSSLNFDFKPSSFPTSPALGESPEKSILKVHTCCTTAASSDLTCIEPLLEWANLFQFVFSNYPVLLSRTFEYFGVFLFSDPSDTLLHLLLPSVRPISCRSYGYWWLSPSTLLVFWQGIPCHLVFL